MSLLGKVGKFLKKAVKTVAPIAAAGVFGPVGAAIGGVIAARGSVSSSGPVNYPQVQALSAMPSMAGLSVLPRIAPGVGRAVAKYGPEIGAGIVGSAIYDKLGNVIGYRKKYRRINPLNARAARRAIRRIKAVRKITHDIEKQLPHRTVRSSAPCPPRRRR